MYTINYTKKIVADLKQNVANHGKYANLYKYMQFLPLV